MQNVFVVSHSVCMDVEGHKILETLGPRSLGMGAWLTSSVVKCLNT